MDDSKKNGQADPAGSLRSEQAETSHGPDHKSDHMAHSVEGHGVVEDGDDRNALITTVATVGVVGVGALVFEAALIPGIVLGVAAALAPNYIPRFGAALNPLFRSTVRGAYKLGRRTREAASEVKEQMSDIAAEVHAEHADEGSERPSEVRPSEVKAKQAAA